MNKQYNEWYWKVYRWFKWEAKYFHKTLIRGFKNLWKWLPVIWKDRDWDHYHMFAMMDFKLKNMIILFEDDKQFVGWENEVRYMKICRELIQRLQDSYYECEYQDYVDYDLELVDNGKNFRLEEKIHRDDIESYINKYPNTYRIVKNDPKYKGFEKDMGTALAMGMERHIKARKLLFKILEEKIEGWWN